MLKNFVRDLLTYAPSKFLPALTALITTPILTRIFPPAEYGNYALALSASALFVVLSATGLGAAVVRFYPAYAAKSALNVFFATTGVFASFAITALALVCWVALLLLKSHIPSALSSLLPLVILIAIVQSVFSISISALRAQGRIRSFTSFSLFVTYASLGIGLLSVWALNFRVDGLLWGSILGYLMALPFLVRLAIKGVGFHPRLYRLSDALLMWHFAWPLALGNVAAWALQLSDLFIIRSFRPEQEVGLYSVSYNISSKSIELLVSLFMLSAGPLLMNTWEKEGRAATERALTMVSRVFIILCVPAAVGLTVLAFPIVALLTVSGYYPGAKIVGFVVFSILAWGLAFIASMGMAIKKKTIRLGSIQIIAASIHVGLQLLLVPRYGYIAAAISTLIGYTTLLVLMTLGSRAYLTWRFPFRTLRNALVASALMGLAAGRIYRLSQSGNKIPPVSLLLIIVAAVPIYFLCLWFLGEAKMEEKQRILKLWAKIVARGKKLVSRRVG